MVFVLVVLEIEARAFTTSKVIHSAHSMQEMNHEIYRTSRTRLCLDKACAAACEGCKGKGLVRCPRKALLYQPKKCEKGVTYVEWKETCDWSKFEPISQT